MARVLLQRSHYPNGGGAPGEAAWNYALIERLADLLDAAGVEVVVVDDFFNKPVPAVVDEDYDLFFASHYDASVYDKRGGNSGCFWDRASGDPLGDASDRAGLAWEDLYPEATGIPLRPDRRNPNTWDYYAFRATTRRTPGIIVEHGCGATEWVGAYPPGDDTAFLHQQIDKVAALDAQAILKFLGIPFEEDEMAKLTDEQRAILDAMAGLNANSSSITGWINQIGQLQADKRALESEVGGLKDSNQRLVAANQQLAGENANLQARVVELENAPKPTVAGASVTASVILDDGGNVWLGGDLLPIASPDGR